jgi:hypothetical protein
MFSGRWVTKMNIIMKPIVPPKILNRNFVTQALRLYVPDQSVKAYKSSGDWGIMQKAGFIKPMSELPQ